MWVSSLHMGIVLQACFIVEQHKSLTNLLTFEMNSSIHTTSCTNMAATVYEWCLLYFICHFNLCTLYNVQVSVPVYKNASTTYMESLQCSIIYHGCMGQSRNCSLSNSTLLNSLDKCNVGLPKLTQSNVTKCTGAKREILLQLTLVFADIVSTHVLPQAKDCIVEWAVFCR